MPAKLLDGEVSLGRRLIEFILDFPAEHAVKADEGGGAEIGIIAGQTIQKKIHVIGQLRRLFIGKDEISREKLVDSGGLLRGPTAAVAGMEEERRRLAQIAQGFLGLLPPGEIRGVQLRDHGRNACGKVGRRLPGISEHLPIDPVVHPENWFLLVELAEHGTQVMFEFVRMLPAKDIHRRSGEHEVRDWFGILHDLDAHGEGRIVGLADDFQQRDRFKPVDRFRYPERR